MSRLNGLLLALISVSTFFSACTKSTSTAPTVGQMSAVITGNQWVTGETWISKGATASADTAHSPVGLTQKLYISASQTSGTAHGGNISLTLTNYTDTGGVFYIDNSTILATYIHSTDTLNYPAVHGTITITSGTQHSAIGYFVFTCKDSTQVTNGIFDVTF